MKATGIVLEVGGVVTLWTALGWGADITRSRIELSHDDGRFADPRGQLRYRVARSPSEVPPVSDVLVFKSGAKVEAYFLEVYGDWLVYYVKESARSWIKEEVLRSDIESIDFHQFLERDPVEPKRIERAKKQPVPKDDILSGEFVARQGRHNRWKLSFLSEIHKTRDYAEDSTDFGTVEIESSSLQGVGDRTYSGDLHATGKYFLHAPGTVNNKEWVLVISEVIRREVDRYQDTTLSTDVTPDQAFILEFSEDKGTFRLQWSNLGEWNWASIVNLEFARTVASEDRIDGTRRPRIGGADAKVLPSADSPRGASRSAGEGATSAPPAGPTRRPERKAGAVPGRAPLELRPGARDLVAREDGEETAPKATSSKPTRTWQVDGWKGPTTYWGGH
jgi:hypothetical protein